MLEKPDIQDQKIVDYVTNVYKLPITELHFLPLGNDVNSASYQLTAANQKYFLKLSKGNFNPSSILVPKHLYDHGIEQIITPLFSKTHKLWENFDSFIVTLYPFIEGKTGFSVELSEEQWEIFGHTLRAIHAAKLPKEIIDKIPTEDFSSEMREQVKQYLNRLANENYTNSTTAELASVIHSKKRQIESLINNAELTASLLKQKHQEFVICHGDIHANNILIAREGNLFITDWDTLVLAPKERDLMFIGGGIGGFWNKKEQEKQFYKGYGNTHIDSLALAYYRCERIIVDIVEVCKRTILNNTSEKDKKKSLEKFIEAFSKDNVVEIALRTASESR